MDVVMSKVSKLQENKTDAWFYEKEMKRMEMDAQRWRKDQGREERQRKEERDVQLKVFQILSGQLSFPALQNVDY